MCSHNLTIFHRYEEGDWWEPNCCTQSFIYALLPHFHWKYLYPSTLFTRFVRALNFPKNNTLHMIHRGNQSHKNGGLLFLAVYFLKNRVIFSQGFRSALHLAAGEVLNVRPARNVHPGQCRSRPQEEVTFEFETLRCPFSKGLAFKLYSCTIHFSDRVKEPHYRHHTISRKYRRNQKLS